MATAISPAQTITANNQTLVFTCPPGQLVNPAYAIVYNKSSYELTVLNALVPAWGIVPINLIALLGGGNILVMQSVLATGVVIAPVASVYVMWLDSSEQPPPPSAFVADAIAAAITFQNTLLATSNLVNNSNVSTTISGVSAFEPYFIVTFVPTVTNQIWLVRIAGITSGNTYAQFTFRGDYQNSAVQMWAFISDPRDTSVAVTVSDLSGASWSAFVSAASSAQQPGFANPVGPTTTVSVANAPGVTSTILAGTSGSLFIYVWGILASWEGITAQGQSNLLTSNSPAVGVASWNVTGTGAWTRDLTPPFPVPIGSGNLQVANTFTGGGQVVSLHYSIETA